MGVMTVKRTFQKPVTIIGAQILKFNALDKNAGISLSNGDLTATSSDASQCVRATRPAAAGQKVYIEWLVVNRAFNPRVGFATAATSLSTNIGTLDTPVESFGLGINSGDLYVHGGAITATGLGTINSGSIGMAYDRTAEKVWVTSNGSSWNPGVGGTQNPATGEGGIDCDPGSQNPDLSYPIFQGSANADSVTIVGAASSWVFSAPSGFSAI